jgi:hypothetical protein
MRKLWKRTNRSSGTHGVTGGALVASAGPAAVAGMDWTSGRVMLSETDAGGTAPCTA